MIRLNIHEAKTHLSRYLTRLTQGERILLCKRNIPIAEIVPLEQKPLKKRPLGLAKGDFVVGKKFFDPLPAQWIAAFEGSKD